MNSKKTNKNDNVIGAWIYVCICAVALWLLTTFFLYLGDKFKEEIARTETTITKTYEITGDYSVKYTYSYGSQTYSKLETTEGRPELKEDILTNSRVLVYFDPQHPEIGSMYYPRTTNALIGIIFLFGVWIVAVIGCIYVYQKEFGSFSVLIGLGIKEEPMPSVNYTTIRQMIWAFCSTFEGVDYSNATTWKHTYYAKLRGIEISVSEEILEGTLSLEIELHPGWKTPMNLGLNTGLVDRVVNFFFTSTQDMITHVIVAGIELESASEAMLRLEELSKQ